MRILCEIGEIEVLNEPTYRFNSTDNSRRYPFEISLSNTSSSFATHGVLLNGDPLAIFADSGCTTVHEHSALYLNGQLFLAIGDKIVCLQPSPFQLMWHIQVDAATCFGIHYQIEQRALISHGELEISGISENGTILWSASGADVFSEGISLHPDYIEAIDFGQRIYRFDYATGEEISKNPR